MRLATFLPNKIDCSILVSPSGIKLGSKLDMIRRILFPLLMFNITSSQKQLDKIANVMSSNSIKRLDKTIIGEVFKNVKLEQDMPKLTEMEELKNYNSPTMLLLGKDDIFFPERQVTKTAKQIIPNLVACNSYEMGHFPSEETLLQIK